MRGIKNTLSLCQYPFLGIDKQSACPAVAADEGVNTLELDMKTNQLFDDAFRTVGRILQKLLRLLPNEIRLYRLVLCARDTDRHSAIHATAILFVGKNKETDLLDDSLANGNILCYDFENSCAIIVESRERMMFIL